MRLKTLHRIVYSEDIIMDTQEDSKLVGKVANLFDLGLTLLFFVLMAFAMRPFVPMQGEGVVEFWAAFTALPMAGVFWLVVQMFRVTLVDQLRRRRSRASTARN